MRTKIHQSRVPMLLVLGALGALASVACGSDANDTGGGLGKGATGGTTGSGAKGSGGTSGTISVGQGGTSTSTGGSSGSSGSSGTAGTDACATINQKSAKTDVALLFMVDISGSMNCPVPETQTCTVDPNMKYPSTRWTEMKPALEDFFGSITAADHLWAGISFFSRKGSCTASDYETPDSEIALLPGAAMSLDAAVNAQTPNGSTPTVPSLDGALTHATAWAKQHADQTVVVVYATDGYPQGCNNNTIDAAAMLAATAFSGPQQIRTYVLGVGPNLTDLNKIASSGGTDTAAFIDTGQDVTAQLTAKFDAIRSAVTSTCTYTVPAPPAGQTLNGQVNVTYNGSIVPFNNTATCDQGWQYNSNMTQIVLCGSTCDQVKADPNADIEMAFGCMGTVTVAPPR
jgi:hypothetical protein